MQFLAPGDGGRPWSGKSGTTAMPSMMSQLLLDETEDLKSLEKTRRGSVDLPS